MNPSDIAALVIAGIPFGLAALVLASCLIAIIIEIWKS